MIEDYLSLLENIITIAGLLDIEIDKKLEEVPTDFVNGSIPFAEDGFLAEDNANLFWDTLNKILKIGGIIQSEGRIKNNVVVTLPMSPYEVSVSDETVMGDTDTGALEFNLPPGADGYAIRVVNAGTSGNNVTISPDGTELLYGLNSSEFLIDLEHLDLQYTTEKGWN